MRIPEQLGSNADDMQVDQGEGDTDAALDKADHQPTQCLNFEISDSFLTSIRLMLAWERNAFRQSKYNDRIKYEELTAAQYHLTSAGNCKRVHKRVSTDLPLLTLTVGNKKFICKGDCNILASFCYVTKLVVCKLFYEKLTRRVDIPFSGITSLHVCFDERGFDTLRIEAGSSLEYFSADKPRRPGMFPFWKVDDSKEDDSFPESRFVFLEIEKGMLEKGLAKLLYMDPRLQRTVEFARASDDQHMYQGRVHAHMLQSNMSVLQPLLSVDALPFIGGRM
ncbi:unnamed protein product [Urochloa decumbens]|uniref:Uncharacterized protein n=1 Tax=Urochloa decumbens TaxID=240449 RepID=A0ABC9DZI6_9POAL